MPGGGHGFQQAYNVQAGVDTETLLVVTETVTPHTNDKQEIEPALKALEELAEPRFAIPQPCTCCSLASI